MTKGSRKCREFILAMKDPNSKVKCETCVKWDREYKQCKDDPVVKKYEDTPNFDRFKSLMQNSKDIIL